MAKTALRLQEEAEMFQAGTSTSGGERNNVRWLANIEAAQYYMKALATSYISRTSPDLIPFEERPAVIEDVTENALIKLWLNTRSPGKIASPKGYAYRTVHSASIDEIRRRKRKPTVSLPLDQDGEVLQGKVLLSVHQGMRDPAAEYELKEFLTEVIDEVVDLPTKQRYGMICVLKDEIGDTFPLAEIFLAQGIDIGPINWPEDPKELQRLRSLLTVARNKLREKFSHSAWHTCP